MDRCAKGCGYCMTGAHRSQPGLVTYVPQSVFIPPEIRSEREPPAALSEDDRMRCDRRTLFYDLILSSERRELLCVGPAFRNLGNPVAISAQGIPVEFAVEDLDTPSVRRCRTAADRRLSITRVLLDETRMGRTVELRFSFRDFSVDASCSLVPTIGRKRVGLTLTTLQKDNDVQWIRDWCIWHHRAHGVERIIIYDNASANIDDVYTNLSSLASPELIFVRWNFPYGPHSLRSQSLFPSFHFAQVGSLNHCRMVFGDCTDWCINLDIDEYLYNNGDAPLLLRLRDRKHRRRSVVYLRSYRVPMTNSFTPRRSFDSPFRSRALRREAMKYMHRPERTAVSGIHRLTTTRRLALRAVRERAAKLLLFTGLLRTGGILSGKVRRIAQRLGLDDASTRLGLCRREDVLFFFHFEALNSGWKRKRRVVRPDPRRFVADDRIAGIKEVLKN